MRGAVQGGMKRLAALVLLLSACVHPGTFSGNVSYAQAVADEAACSNMAEALTWGYTGLALATRYVRVYDNCMLSRGYTRAN